MNNMNTLTPERLAAAARRKALATQHLKGDLRRLLAELVPGGKAQGPRFMGLPPHRDSDNASCFSVYLTGEKAGAWIDFVSGEKGDLWGLIMLVKGLDFAKALRWAEDRYGLRSISAEERLALHVTVEKRRSLDDAAARKKRDHNIRSACVMFSKAIGIEGTVVDNYLLGRGIDLAALPHRDIRWLRFLPRATYWMDKARPQMPAMIAGMVDGQGLMKACHLTFLRPDGRGKADVEKPKLMWPEVKGLVIRINHGIGGQPETSQNALPLMLCEGIEDGLSIAMGEPDLRIWAASSLANLASVPDHRCADCYVVARDNDWGKPAAAAGFERALKHLKATKKPVVAVSASTGKDFNNQLQEER